MAEESEREDICISLLQSISIYLYFSLYICVYLLYISTSIYIYLSIMYLYFQSISIYLCLSIPACLPLSIYIATYTFYPSSYPSTNQINQFCYIQRGNGVQRPATARTSISAPSRRPPVDICHKTGVYMRWRAQPGMK